ncbi:ABC transporter substrate-binding protein [Myceligenerans pegani]|uniref:Carbohydrate ABC transporter substrate-binding protein n=1 Tax=Myceligenerans pegani TaxID=2776917 RepID=A0ABR9N2X9_9MICO|nr:ABC transporter substrate-binding protein [Myceligenerans sp. TRM 65318]MBE1878010.1 carbohydrate ABC transporter substrate-binding protein [Myceligenerans sp. TRM 65318]MBE3020281.1 carbohydrate ABC transporter substrate-binding protein [Myceligenerans sp. TRM 65318]
MRIQKFGGRRRGIALAAGVASTALVLGACADTGDGSGGDGGEAAEDFAIDCAAYEEFGDLEGTTVSVYTTIVEPEAETQQASYEPFEECTGVEIEYEGSREMEAQLPVRVQAGNPPDIAILPQPGLLNTLVTEYDAVLPAPASVEANVDEFWEPVWKEYGTVDGTFYAAPLGSNVKSFVWYSPSMFADAGYEIPETWDDLLTLTETIAGETEGAAKPWCAGVESGDATGWPATDWIEDMVLRSAGPDVYDQWVSHEIAFDDPQIVEAFDMAGEILKNPDYVNGGLGGVDSIATASWTDAGYPILEGNCWMHRAANFYATQWPEGTEVGPEGDVYAFYLPSVTTDEKPVLVAGEFIAAFESRPEVEAFQTFLSSPDWANSKAVHTPAGGWVSANLGLDPENLATDFDQLTVETLQDPATVSRFDGSDLMPAAVGTDSFWSGMTEWFASDRSTEQVTSDIEQSWP